jgi:hypothetical protein
LVGLIGKSKASRSAPAMREHRQQLRKNFSEGLVVLLI